MEPAVADLDECSGSAPAAAADYLSVEAAITHAQDRRRTDSGVRALARRFGDALRCGDGAAAERVIEAAIDAGLAPEAIQSLVIAPAMVEIGELWQARIVSVADEHLATSISQRALLRLFEILSTRRVRARSRERVLLAAVEGQRHVLGLRMVADVLESAGFDVLYLGEGIPLASLRAFVAQHRPAVVGLAYGVAGDERRLADALAAVHEIAPQARIMLGGAAVPAELRSAGYPHVTSTIEVVGAVEALLTVAAQRPPPVVDRLRAGGTPRVWSRIRERPVETDPVAERLAKTAEQATDIARGHIRRAEEFRELAFRDPLTELANRRAFDDELRTLAQDPRGGALLMIDVDAFKAVNDERGHDDGDRVLRAIGQTIRRSLRPGDMAARFGGDEFAVLLPGATAMLACDMGERIRIAVATDVAPFSVSVGVAELSGDPRGALLAADFALYEAKGAGRDRVVRARGPRFSEKGGAD
jgi:diguanylate cyclase (GGDEF)-like protein